jgi:hypothetical protein
MEQGATKPTVHPLKLLAKAYGGIEGAANAELDAMLSAAAGRLTTS